MSSDSPTARPRPSGCASPSASIVTGSAWTIDGGATALIEINLGTAEERTDACAEITPAQARAVAAALLELADIAEHAEAG